MAEVFKLALPFLIVIAVVLGLTFWFLIGLLYLWVKETWEEVRKPPKEER